MKIVRENLLKKIARKSNHKQFKHSAIILDGSKFVSQGFNWNEKHAEEMAINGVKHLRSLKGTTLISFRINRTSNIGNSRPCKKCESLLRSFGIKSVIYFVEGRWYQVDY